MPLYERTHTRPDHKDSPEWMAGYTFEGVATGGGIAEKFHPKLGPRVHSTDSVQLVPADSREQVNQQGRELVAKMNAQQGQR